MEEEEEKKIGKIERQGESERGGKRAKRPKIAAGEGQAETNRP